MWTGNGRASLGERDYRASFELRDEDLEACRAARPVAGLSNGFQRPNLPSGSNKLSQNAMAAFQAGAAPSAGRVIPPAPLDEQALQWQAQHPCILTSFPAFLERLEGKRLAMFLDYDGTLAPIVSNPDEAYMSEQMRSVVRGLALMFPTAIISGRGREKVESFVQLKELYYAGSHGMDIASPKVASNGSAVEDGTFQPAVQFKPLIDKVYGELKDRLQHIPGAAMEHNVFCVSAHYRNCAGDAWQEVVTIVEEVVATYGAQLRTTRGRKVVEIRPKVDWHKGTALRHLLDVLHLSGQADVVALYVGDDHTDEDAFKELKESHMGLGVLVSTKVKPTDALYTVRDPSEVQELLSRLITWGATSSNGWHSLTAPPPRGVAPLATAAAAAPADMAVTANGGGGGEQGGDEEMEGIADVAQL